MQINLGRGFAAYKECLRAAEDNGISILLIQEPYVGSKGYVTSPYRTVQLQTADPVNPVKAAIIILDSRIKVIENPNWISHNIVGVKIQFGNFNLGIISVYSLGTGSMTDDTDTIQSIATEMSNIVLGGDINATSPWWGCNTEDRRGATFVDMVAQLQMQVVNDGNEPTFYIYRGNNLYKSIVDVTACSEILLDKINDWKVDSELVTLSDHRAITFNINLEIENTYTIKKMTTRKFKTKNVDWNKFRDILNKKLIEENLNQEHAETISSEEEIEHTVSSYVQSVVDVCDRELRTIPNFRQFPRNTWWTRELTEQKKYLIRLKRKIKHANNHRKIEIIKEYAEEKEKYKQNIQEAITTSWKTFCTEQQRETMWERAYRILRKTSARKEETLLKSPDGSRILTPQESAEL